MHSSSHFSAKKINKRVWIVNDKDEKVYTPPDFVKAIGRHNFQEVCDKFNNAGKYDILAIMDFESDVRFRYDLRRKFFS